MSTQKRKTVSPPSHPLLPREAGTRSRLLEVPLLRPGDPPRRQLVQIIQRLGVHALAHPILLLSLPHRGRYCRLSPRVLPAPNQLVLRDIEGKGVVAR